MLRPHFLAATGLLLILQTASWAVPAVTGIAKRSYYTDTATVTVTRTAGNTYAAWIDGVPVDPAVAWTETRFGYHEFKVTETVTATNVSTSDTWQFIIKDSYRGGSSSNTYPEAGLGRWVPLRSIDAPDEVLDAAPNLTVISPARLPAGFSLPVISRLTEADGSASKLIGTMKIDGASAPSTLRIYRGGGSRVVTAPAAGTHSLTCSLGTRTVTRPLTVDASPAWQTLSGAGGGRTFAANSYIDVTGTVTVAAGTTLTLGPGCVLRCAQGVEFEILGTLAVNGTAAAPVVFGPAAGAVWGGIWVHSAGSQASMKFAMLTGGGANPTWITSHSMHSHKAQQPLFTWSDNGGATLEDCFIVENPSGQCIHGDVSTAPVTLRRCVLQKSISGGQVHECVLSWENNHLLEMPVDSAFADAAAADSDYDGLYISGGSTTISQSVFGWVKDDGTDSGSGATSNVSVTNCWWESCLHEGMAWSEGGSRTVRDCVAMNCGQGMECGFTGQGSGTPSVDAQRVYLTGNLNGIRYGDNYDWSYSGKFDVHDSLSLYNGDDVFGIHWGIYVGATAKNWTYVGSNRTSAAYMHLEALGAPQNLGATIVSVPQTEHPAIPTWDPGSAAHLARLAPFLTQPAGKSGCGIAQDTRLFSRASYGGQVSVRLDRPVTVSRSIPWRITGKTTLNSSTSTTLATGALPMPAGCQAATISVPALGAGGASYAAVTLTLGDSPNCLVTGPPTVTWADLSFPPAPPTPSPTTLLARTTTGWKYLAQSSAAPAGWDEPSFADTTWTGPVTSPLQTAEAALGGTAVPANPANATRPYNTTYFRRKFTVTDKSAFATLAINCMRDDGVVVYLNGNVLKWDNVPSATLAYDTPASVTINGTAEAVWNNWPALPVTDLVNGVNTIAIEVHQADITGTPPLTASSDMRLDFELLGQPPAPAAPVNYEAAQLDGTIHLLWSETGLVLQCSQDLSGSWLDMPEARPPFPIIPDSRRLFYRLRRP